MTTTKKICLRLERGSNTQTKTTVIEVIFCASFEGNDEDDDVYDPTPDDYVRITTSLAGDDDDEYSQCNGRIVTTTTTK